MGNLRELLTVTVSDDYLTAQLMYNKDNIGELKKRTFTELEIRNFLQQEKVTYGLIEENIQQIVQQLSVDMFPIEVAQGYVKTDGKDGNMQYSIDTNTTVDHSDSKDFRNVMRLPIVQRETQIAILIPPTEGKNGMTVTGKEIKAKAGKPLYMKAGKNVHFNESDQSFYAKADGLVNFGMKAINIYTIYEVNEDISMRTGNIDFNGSVIIRGDVPSGFTVKAAGDIKIFGLVEAANIKAGGSIYVAEGIAGLKKGVLEAGEDVYIGYINQANIKVGRSIHVENSVLHSDCSAGYDITCHRGNIIGGTLFAGYSIEAKDIGNRIHTPTQLSVGVDHEDYKKHTALSEEKETLLANMQKLHLISKKLGSKEQNVSNSKEKITLTKLHFSQKKIQDQLIEVENQLQKMKLISDTIQYSDVKVFGTIYPNTVIAFGKYHRKIDQNYQQVVVKLEHNDIVITHH